MCQTGNPYRVVDPVRVSVSFDAPPAWGAPGRLRCILSRLVVSAAHLVSQNGRFWAVFGCFQDDRRYAKQVFTMRAVVLSWQ